MGSSQGQHQAVAADRRRRVWDAYFVSSRNLYAAQDQYNGTSSPALSSHTSIAPLLPISSVEVVDGIELPTAAQFLRKNMVNSIKELQQ